VELNKKANDYLKTACEKDERIFIKPDIALVEGILVLNSRGDALLPLLETAPTNAVPDKIIAYRLRFQKESREGSIRIFREIQYGYAISWDDNEALSGVWRWAADKIPSEALEQKFFIETGKGKIYQRARKAFWEQAGLRERVLKDSLQIKAWRDKRWHDVDILRWSEADILKDILKEYERSKWEYFDLPVDAPSARYALSVEDISTLEDRAHWVARGRITLMERDTGETVAEYVGFEANLEPWEQAKSPSRYWDDNWSSYKLCPSADSYLHSKMLSLFLKTVEKGARETVPNFKELLTEKKP
jgi:hypothetical protein